MDSISRSKNLHMRPLPGSDEAIAEAQAIVRKFVPEGVSLVDKLIRDRELEVRISQRRRRNRDSRRP